MSDSKNDNKSLCKHCQNMPFPPVWRPGKGMCGHEVNPIGIFKYCFSCARDKKICARCGTSMSEDSF